VDLSQPVTAQRKSHVNRGVIVTRVAVAEHYREKRIDRKQYFDYLREYGLFAKFTLYWQNGTWTDEKPAQCNDS
jgi:hypothetical protein